MKKETPVDRARARLRQAIDRACIARGEAKWTNGYRAGRWRYVTDDGEDDRLYKKEMAQFEECDKAEQRVERLIAAYALAVRRAKR